MAYALSWPGSSAGLTKVFDALSYTRRKEAGWRVSDAITLETRDCRTASVVRSLEG